MSGRTNQIAFLLFVRECDRHEGDMFKEGMGIKGDRHEGEMLGKGM